MASTLIQGLSYYKIDSDLNSNAWLNPIDNNGNQFPIVTVEYDTTTIASTLTLPYISPSNAGVGEPTLDNNLGFTLKVINTGTKALKIVCPSSDQIGTLSEVTLTNQYNCAILTPISLGVWSIELTA